MPVIHADMIDNNDIMSAYTVCDVGEKIPTDEKYYYKCPLCVRICM